MRTKSQWERDAAVIIGKHAKALRLSRGVNRCQFAARAGLERSCTARLERGQHIASVLTLKRYADGLGVPLSTLLAPLDNISTGEVPGEEKKT